MEVISYSVEVRESLRQDYSRTFEDSRGQWKVRKSVTDFRGLSRTVLHLVRESSRSDFPRFDFRGRSLTFAERDFGSNVNKFNFSSKVSLRNGKVDTLTLDRKCWLCPLGMINNGAEAEFRKHFWSLSVAA